MSMFGGWRRRGPGVIPALVAAITILVLLASASGLGVAAPGPARSLATHHAALDSTPTQADVAAVARTFPTGYQVLDDRIWDYFQRRGGVRTFGMPVSNVFRLQGTPVQIFQRHVLQVQAGNGVTVLNLLDGFLPYARFNGSTIPQADPQLLAQSPRPDQQDYAEAALNFVQLHAPDTWNGMPVNFQRTFMQTVTCADAYPDGDCREDL